jgi:transcriptional regulator with XRE-family HTH domain
MVHRGEIVQDVLKQNGITLTKLSKKIGYSTRNLYNFFEKHDLGLDIIFNIGKAIKYDFSKHFKELETFDINDFQLINRENYTFDNYLLLQEKYINLLEKYNELLEKTK